MLDLVLKFANVFIALFKLPVIILCTFIGFYLAAVLFWLTVGYFKGRRINRGSVKPVKQRSMFLRLFWDAPRRYAEDLFNSQPDFFKPQGLIIFTGMQGSGKTTALMQYAIDLLDTYPKAKCLSNTKFVYQDAQMRHWRQLINYKNGHMGVIAILDELQNWFGSNQSRNFPPEMLSVITQNRKNRRVILGTAQNFHLLAKSIRTQCTEIRQCHTLAGVLTIVVKRCPVCDEHGDVKELKYRGMYFFVHNDRLRDSFDTYSVVEALSKDGFHDNPFLKEPEVVVKNE